MKLYQHDPLPYIYFSYSLTENFVSEAHMVLKGHRSIVNEVRFNPQNFIIASSGVEKIVKVCCLESIFFFGHLMNT